MLATVSFISRMIDVLRQLKREVDEENRLRRLMVPIQQTMLDFETRLLRTVQETIKVCFERPSNSLTEERLESLQASLNAAVSDNWDTFASNNKKDIVNEKNPKKHYLKINYPFKNDPLVMTLHKGELERKSGVLNKYTQRFFVLTECKSRFNSEESMVLIFISLLCSWIPSSI